MDQALEEKFNWRKLETGYQYDDYKPLFEFLTEKVKPEFIIQILSSIDHLYTFLDRVWTPVFDQTIDRTSFETLFLIYQYDYKVKVQSWNLNDFAQVLSPGKTFNLVPIIGNSEK